MSNRKTDRARVDLQVRKLSQLGGDGVRRDHLELLELRRRHRGTEASGMERMPVECIARMRQESSRVPIVMDEMLVAGGVLERARSLLGTDCRGVADDDARGAVRRVRVPATSDTTAMVQYLRDRGVACGWNHVVALAWRMKGGDTPEPADALLAAGRVTGDGTLVVVIDTGIDAAAIADGHGEQPRRTDGWLNGVRLADDDRRHVDPLDLVEPVERLDLAAGHGTFVAGVIRQTDPSADVVMIRALDTEGLSCEGRIAEAVQRAAAIFTEHGGPGVLNLSFGLESVDDSEPIGLRTALDTLPDDVLVVAAAGNGDTGIPMWPAASKRVLGVASLDERGRPSAWSNRGHWVDFSAQGEGVLSTFVAGTEAEGSGEEGDLYDPDPDTFEGPDARALWSGTSFATAKVTGLLARSIESGTSPAQAVRTLRERGTYVPGFGYRVGLDDQGSPGR